MARRKRCRNVGVSRAAVTRLLALLRAHGLIVKVQKSHRYHLSASGPRNGDNSLDSPWFVTQRAWPQDNKILVRSEETCWIIQ